MLHKITQQQLRYWGTPNYKNSRVATQNCLVTKSSAEMLKNMISNNLSAYVAQTTSNEEMLCKGVEQPVSY